MLHAKIGWIPTNEQMKTDMERRANKKAQESSCSALGADHIANFFHRELGCHRGWRNPTRNHRNLREWGQSVQARVLGVVINSICRLETLHRIAAAILPAQQQYTGPVVTSSPSRRRASRPKRPLGSSWVPQRLRQRSKNRSVAIVFP